MATPTYQNTRIGWLYADPSAPYEVKESEVTVFQMDRYSDIPEGHFTSDSLFKYFSTETLVNTQYIHLNVEVQAGWTGSDWTTVDEFAREVGKDTFPSSQAVPFPAGVMGSFRCPIYGDATHYRVVMKTFGGDSTGEFNMVCGLSNDRFYGDLTPRAT